MYVCTKMMEHRALSFFFFFFFSECVFSQMRATEDMAKGNTRDGRVVW